MSMGIFRIRAARAIVVFTSPRISSVFLVSNSINMERISANMIFMTTIIHKVDSFSDIFIDIF